MVDKQKLSEEEAGVLYEAHSPYVYGIALMLTRSPAIADDITQETFLRVFQKYHTYDPSRPLRPWLYRITVNLVKSMNRKQKWLLFQDALPERHDGNTLEDGIVRNEGERELWEAVNELSPKRREVIILHYYAGLTLPEVASVLRIREGTCKSRLHEALKGLRKSDVTMAMGVPCKEEMQ
ncbi:sigma-70 family RNA polymerase sigma factor [Paenibacillus sp.]|uniref:RNA polymerase sigma factor n=1 Tax=Paenibacillus sp. TaxID=58172 RepID=UPI0028375B28|nr:sigma-70 family RNA polymerase sigma factor [Paenibacillus sp.]MDR0269573.1 sigma-70 family RNA polymerase sigma factor [Paenibacillus sp.]